MLTDIGQHLLYISATELKQYFIGAQGTFCRNPPAESVWQVVKNIAKNSAKAIPLLSGRNA